MVHPYHSERPSPIHFPIKITLGFCLFCKSGQVSIRVQQRDYTVSDNGALVVFAGQIVEKVDVRKDTKLIFAALDSEYIMTGIRGPHGKNIRQMMIHSHEPIKADLGETEGDNFIHLCQSVKHIISNCDSQTADGILSGFSYIFASLLLKWTRQGTQNLSLSASREKEILLRFEEDLHNFSRKDKTVSFYARRQCISDKHFSRTIKKGLRTQAFGYNQGICNTRCEESSSNRQIFGKGSVRKARIHKRLLFLSLFQARHGQIPS